ncbi:MAG: hypothetical protein GX219_01225 [Tissierellia bacterium]|nr:hypothetical protein [Tissierellia bacterium]
MDTPMTLEAMLKFILFLLGIGAMVYLIIFFRNLSRLMGNANKLLEENIEDLDGVLKSLPPIIKNVEEISAEANKMIGEMEPDLVNITANVADITDKFGSVSTAVESTAMKAADTIDIVSGSISDTAYAFSSNVNSIDKYIALVLEVLEQIKIFIKKR